MKLEAWLKAKDMTQLAFAERSGLSQTTISRLISEPEKRKPGWDVIKAVYDATDGAVTANDLFDFDAPEQADAAQ